MQWTGSLQQTSEPEAKAKESGVAGWVKECALE